jgi:hypothetical protein
MGRPLTEAAHYRKILLRIPNELLTLAKARALAEDRSLNAQLVQFIRQALPPEKETATR